MSNGAQYVTLQKYFSHLTLIFFPTPPIKLKLGLHIEFETNCNPVGPIKFSSRSKQGSITKYDLSIRNILFQYSPGPWKWYICSRSQQSTRVFAGWYDCWTSSKISSTGSHTEHRWRCSYRFDKFEPTWCRYNLSYVPHWERVWD